MARVRAGELPREAMELAAFLGDPAALAALGGPLPEPAPPEPAPVVLLLEAAQAAGDAQQAAKLLASLPRPDCDHEFPFVHRVADIRLDHRAARFRRCILCAEAIWGSAIPRERSDLAPGVPLRLSGPALWDWAIEADCVEDLEHQEPTPFTRWLGRLSGWGVDASLQAALAAAKVATTDPRVDAAELNPAIEALARGLVGEPLDPAPLSDVSASSAALLFEGAELQAWSEEPALRSAQARYDACSAVLGGAEALRRAGHEAWSCAAARGAARAAASVVGAGRVRLTIERALIHWALRRRD
ncbi:MAG: hypothetical protein AB7N76_06415 [Planctomycetota bacterium]